MSTVVRARLLAIGLLSFFFIFEPSFSYCYRMPNFPTGEKAKLIETAHFRIIHQESLSDSAPVIASWFEEAHENLTAIFHWNPPEKIDVLYVDSYDVHNGWATPLSHNLISIYAAGSGQGSSIYQPGSYLKRTIYHELTHILTMDARYGYNKALSGIFGKVNTMGDPLSALMFLLTSSPSSLAPTWLLEGEAIWSETEFTAPGRGQSSFTNMIFRCAVRDDNLLPLSKWYLEIPHWPYGLGAYLYGARLIQYVYENDDNKNAIGDLNLAVANSSLFNSSRAIRKNTGKNFKTLAQEMLQSEKIKQRGYLDVLGTLEETGVERLTPRNISVTQSVFLNDRLYFLGHIEEQGSSVFVYDIKTGKPEQITGSWDSSPYGMIAVSGDGKSLIYSKLQIQNSENLWFEIHLLDPVTGRDRILTEKGRYKWVGISPDNRNVVAASQCSGKSLLLELDMDEKGVFGHETVIESLSFQWDLTSPAYSPDGTQISYVMADENSFKLVLFDRVNKTKKTVLETASQIISPIWHPSGDLLLYSSDENGVHNLYQIDIKEMSPPIPLTHVTGGLFFPSVSHDGKNIAVTSYDGYGAHLTVVPYDPEAFTDQKLPVIEGEWERKHDIAETTESEQELQKTTDTKGYNSLSNIRFDYWTPWLTASTHGIQGGLGASFSDPSGFQDIKGLIGVESEYGSVLGSLHYVYSGLRPQFHLYGASDQEVYPGLLASNSSMARYDHAEDVRRIGASVEYPILRRDRRVLFGVGYEYKTRDFIDDVEDGWQGADLDTLPSDEDEGAVWAKIGYEDGDVHGRSASLEKGRAIAVSFELTRPELGGTMEKSRYLLDWNEYISMPFFDNHVFKISAAYGGGSGDDYAQGLFGLGGGAVFSPSDLLPGMPSSLGVRGYDSNFLTGDQVAAGGLAYRFPIWDFSKGYESGFPIYTRQIFAELFFEGGRVWDEKGYTDDLDWIWSVGTEVNFAMKIFRHLAISPGLGVAYAPDRDYRDDDLGELYIYLSLKGWVNY